MRLFCRFLMERLQLLRLKQHQWQGLTDFVGEFLQMPKQQQLISLFAVSCTNSYLAFIREFEKHAIPKYSLFISALSIPFHLGVVTDNQEACTTSADAMATLCETSETPGGILGFALGYTQKSC